MGVGGERKISICYHGENDARERPQNRRAGETAGRDTMKKHTLNLRMFDGEGGAAAAPGTQAPGATVPAAAAQQAETRPASEGNNEDLNARFADMISGEYKDAYNQHMQSVVKDRLQKQGAKHEKAEQELRTEIAKRNDLLNLIGSKYGITDGNLERIQAEIESDTTYWEDAAAKEGLSVDQYMRLKKMERENAEFRKAQEDAARLQQRERLFAKWTQEAEELSKVYSGFNLQVEMQNPDFARLLGSNVNMRTAYEVLHHDEIMGGAMAYTAQTVAKKQIDAIKNGQSHPMEGAASTTQAVKTSKDLSKMSLQEMREYAKRARNGEKITFREE